MSSRNIKTKNIFHALQQHNLKQLHSHDFSDREMSMHEATCLIKDWMHHEGLVNMGHQKNPENVMYSYQRNHITVIVIYPISTDKISFMCVKDNVAHFHHLACIGGAVKTAEFFQILDAMHAWAASGLLAAWKAADQHMQSTLQEITHATVKVFEHENEGTRVYAYVLDDTMLCMLVMVKDWKVEAVCPTTFIDWQYKKMWNKWCFSFPGILDNERKLLETLIGHQSAHYFTAFNVVDLHVLQEACLVQVSAAQVSSDKSFSRRALVEDNRCRPKRSRAT